MKRSAVVASFVGAALALVTANASADLPLGTPAGEWLRSGGAILDLQVTPASANVELDGDRVRAGPALVTPGVHLLVVRANGRREHREIVRVPAGARTPKRVALEPVPVTGRLDLRITPHHARLLVDGRLVAIRLARSSPRPLVLTAGRHRIEIIAQGYRTIRKIVRVPRGATLTLRIDMTPERRRRHRPRVV